MNVASRFTLLALLASTLGFAQSAATVTAVPATARVYKPITLKLTNAGLSFGDIYSAATQATITLDPVSETRTTGGSALASTGSAYSAHFTVGGKRNATYSITLPATAVSLTGPAGSTPMVVDTFKASVGTGAAVNPAVGLIPDTLNGTQDFKVGANLTVGASQADGDYTGSFNVTVTYN